MPNSDFDKRTWLGSAEFMIRVDAWKDGFYEKKQTVDVFDYTYSRCNDVG